MDWTTPVLAQVVTRQKTERQIGGLTLHAEAEGLGARWSIVGTLAGHRVVAFAELGYERTIEEACAAAETAAHELIAAGMRP
jgi:hypothetical protein